jgi:predicted RNase H-like HicB family nuclease
MRYAVVYEEGPNNYNAFVPELPVVLVVANTLEELAAEAREAIEFHLEGEGRPVAAGSIEVELVAGDDYDGDMLTITGARVPLPRSEGSGVSNAGIGTRRT